MSAVRIDITQARYANGGLTTVKVDGRVAYTTEAHPLAEAQRLERLLALLDVENIEFKVVE